MELNQLRYSRQRGNNLYNSQSTKPYQLSRWRIEKFIRCPRCFYLDLKLGIEPYLGPHPLPGTPHLGIAVHALLRKEFDEYRLKKKPHPYITESGIKAIPLNNDEISSWRNWRQGVRYHDETLNMIFMGVIDDLWVKEDGTLIIVDYKTASHSQIDLNAGNLKQFHKRQIEFYQWLFAKKGFKVSDTGIFVYCNGLANRPGFSGRLDFDVKLLPYKGDISWVDPILNDARECLKSNSIPKPSPNCVPCQYVSAYNQTIKFSDRPEHRKAA